MNSNEKYMNRCIELARLGAQNAAPNPMVGSVVVHNGKIIGEGYHQKHGDAHAEVNAINAVIDKSLLKDSTIFVTLEPCAHFGLTPPCSDLIVENKIPRVVIGTIDPFAKVAGKGIEKLKNAGIDVTIGVLEEDCAQLNKRFFTFHEKKRPYVILKWAQTTDGFIDIERDQNNYGEPTWITGDLALRLVHKIRAEEGAILVGRKTAEKDNPSLTVRNWVGKNPKRLVLDSKLQLSKSLKLFDNSQDTLVFNSLEDRTIQKTSFVKIDFETDIVPQILDQVYRLNIQSIIVEGGRQLLESFISANKWDEAHIFVGGKMFYAGVRAPHVYGKVEAKEELDSDRLFIVRNS